MEARGFASSSTLEEWHTSLLVWGLSTLALAALARYKWLKLRTAESSPTIGSRLSKASGVLLSVGIVLTFFSATSPLIADKLKPKEPVWPAEAPASSAKMALSIPSMDCASCARWVNVYLGQQRGVEKAELSIPKFQAIVWYDPSKTSETNLLADMRKHGLEAQKAP